MTDPPREPQLVLDEVRTQALAGDPALALRVLADSPAARREPDAAWLAGVALGALGRYAPAAERLTGASAATARRAPRCQATVASVYRQVGMHGRAREWDLRAARGACFASDRVALFDARLGLAADAVGSGDLRTARSHLHGAAAVLPRASGGDWARDHWPRERVRMSWVRCEVGLLASDLATAAAAAESAVDACEGVSPRHLSKSLMFRGVAVARPQDGLDDLRRAMRIASEVGAVPLVWPTGLLLARHSPDPDERARAQRSAADAYRAIGAYLTPEMAAVWWRAPAALELGLEQRQDVP